MITRDAVVTICSRRESRRVPEKVFRKLAGRTVLEHILRRVSGLGLPVHVLVPYGQGDLYRDRLPNEFAKTVSEGTPHSPLHRTGEFLASLKKLPKWTVRITHDDPIIDPVQLGSLLDCCEQADSGGDRKGKLGYGVVRNLVEGAGAEVIRSENVIHAANKRKEPTEYLTYFVRGEGLPYPATLDLEASCDVRRPYRLTLDYPEDVLVLETVLRACGKDASAAQLCRWLDANQAVLQANRLPELSIYTCAKDAGPWVPTCIASVAGHATFHSYEYVFVDDGSTDSTLQEAVSRGWGWARTHANEDNLGLASSCNVALSMCRGRHVMRLDADDSLDYDFADHYQEMRALLKAGAHVVYPAYREMDEFGHREEAVKDPREHHHAGGAVFDKRFLDEMRFKETIRSWEGLELYQRLKMSGAKIAYYDKPTWNYRIHAGSMSRTNLEQREKEKQAILRPK